jgi:hypothetical protein
MEREAGHRGTTRSRGVAVGLGSRPLPADPVRILRRSAFALGGRHISRADARWTGELLGRLSTSQLHEAFRAAGYSPAGVEGFTQVLTSRIETLNRL